MNYQWIKVACLHFSGPRNHSVSRFSKHRGESIGIRAYARDLRSRVDPESASLGAIRLGPRIIALDSPAISERWRRRVVSLADLAIYQVMKDLP